ncbi:Hpt domain-containing protein [Deefgea piscis]|uniref:Hpt domain-containing protein n=1 Tax=Deefgea piscis TaxID=2739061 RepID=A0A6M8SR05_9NEIS|nr:Hpt domain-containing protein [Deefgea piscis]QKJ67712.1 Hpt domain-containing protein [Deefgea piscis]
MPAFNEALFAAGMIELKAKFVAGLPARLKQIVPTSPIPTLIWQADEDVLNELHRLAGAAGSLGFDSLANTARQLEKELQALPRDAKLSLRDFEKLEQAAAAVLLA